MKQMKFIKGVGIGLAVGAAAAGVLVSQRRTLMNTKAGRTIRSVGHTVSDAAQDLGDVFRG